MVKTTQLHKNVKLDEDSVAPNHFHGIIILEDIGVCKMKTSRICEA
ncbi:MAG: hypothetical protein V1759_03455 [bacterium]